MIPPTDKHPATQHQLDELINRACEADPLPPYDEEPEPPRGPPLSADERHSVQLSLATFQSPTDFAALTDALCDRCNSEDWLNRPYLKFLHDAYVLAEFVKLMPIESVRLAGESEQWPDGYITAAGKTHSIEITSTHGGRKLGKEYRGEQSVRMDPIENWIARAESIPHYLREAIEAKSKKNYASPCWLVVYLNINEFDIRQAETERAIETIKAQFAPSFEMISVLWKATGILALRRGVRFPEIFPVGLDRLMAGIEPAERTKSLNPVMRGIIDIVRPRQVVDELLGPYERRMQHLHAEGRHVLEYRHTAWVRLWAGFGRQGDPKVRELILKAQALDKDACFGNKRENLSVLYAPPAGIGLGHDFGSSRRLVNDVAHIRVGGDQQTLRTVRHDALGTGNSCAMRARTFIERPSKLLCRFVPVLCRGRFANAS